MRSFLVLILSHLVLAQSVRCEGLGLDILGLSHPKVKCQEVIDAWPKGWGIGYLFGTFGSSTKCLERLLATGNVGYIRAHGLNGPGLRNKALEKTEVHYGHDVKSFDKAIRNRDEKLIKAIKDRAAKTEGLARRAGIPCYYSSVLEHNLSLEAVEIANAAIREAAPSCFVINNPVNDNNSTNSADVDLLEGHGISKNPRVKKCAVSHDGESAFDTNSTEYLNKYANCKLRFFWDARFNLRQNGEFVPPSKRYAAPSAKYIRAITRLEATASERIFKPEAPARIKKACGKGVLEIKRPEVYKVAAEDKVDNKDVRALKPLLISRVRGDVEVLDSNAKRIAIFKYFGGFDNNTHRAYSGTGSNLWGFELENKAKKGGSPWVWFKLANGECRGPVIPSHREGYFR